MRKIIMATAAIALVLPAIPAQAGGLGFLGRILNELRENVTENVTDEENGDEPEPVIECHWESYEVEYRSIFGGWRTRTKYEQVCEEV